jgi:hypothetical protein
MPETGKQNQRRVDHGNFPDLSMNIRNGIKFWLRRPLWLRAISILTIAVMVAGIGYLSVPRVRAILRDRQAKENMAEAREALKLRRYPQARAAAMDVLRAGFNNPEAALIVLESMENLSDPRLIEVAVLVLLSESQPRADRLHAWEICCREGPMGIVTQALPMLAEKDRDAEDFRLPLADRLIMERIFPDALKVIGISDDDEKVELPIQWEERLVKLLITMGTADSTRLAQQRIALRLASNPQEAARLLPLTDEIPFRQLITQFHDALSAAAPSAGEEVDAHLRRLRTEAAIWMIRQDDLITELLSVPADPLTLAHWALLCDRPQKAADLIPAEIAAADLRAFGLRAEALRRLGDWTALLATLEAAPDGVVEAEIQVDVAAVCEHLGDRTGVNHASEEAIIIARLASETQSMVRLAKYAEKRNLPIIARNAWVEAAKRGVGPMPLYERLRPMIGELEAERREEELGILVMAYRRIEPNNPVVMVHHHYIALLRGLLTPQLAQNNLRPLVEKSPGFLPARMTLVFAGLLDSLPPADLLALLDDANLDWATTSPPNRALRGLALAADGRIDEANAILDSIPWETLLPSEIRIFQGLRRQFLNQSTPVDIEALMPKNRPLGDDPDINAFLPKIRKSEDLPNIDHLLPKKFVPTEDQEPPKPK